MKQFNKSDKTKLELVKNLIIEIKILILAYI